MILSKKKLETTGQLQAQPGSKRSKTVVNGDVYSSYSSVANIQRANKFFAQKSISVRVKSDETNDIALDVLNTIGVSVVTATPYATANFSLLSVQTDTEIISNENILDARSFQKPIQPTTLTDKFKNSQDPIYMLDEAPSISARNMRESIVNAVQVPSVVDLTSQMCMLNENNTEISLKYFSVPKISDRAASFHSPAGRVPSVIDHSCMEGVLDESCMEGLVVKGWDDDLIGDGFRANRNSMGWDDDLIGDGIRANRNSISQAHGNHPTIVGNSISQAVGDHPTIILNTKNVYKTMNS
jgi:hypothetical protein